MGLQLSPWMLPPAFGLGLALAATPFAWGRRAVHGGTLLTLLALSTAWWCLFQLVGVSAPTLPGKLFFSKLRYLGVTTAPLLWLYFSLEYTGRGDLLRRWWLHLVAVPAALTLVLAVTNEAHGLIWLETGLVEARGFAGMRVAYGEWFELYRWYSYALAGAGTLLLILHLARVSESADRLAAVVLAPTAAVLLNGLHLNDPRPALWTDLTAPGVTVAVAVVTWTLLRDGFLDLPRVARTAVLEALADGVVVVDRQDRITDLNRSARDILNRGRGDPVPEVFLQPPDGAEPRLARTEVEGEERVWELAPAPLEGREGRVLVFRDVTARHEMEQSLRRTTEALSRANAELEKLAHTDSLTGLGNRRAFMQALGREVERANRYLRTLAVLVLDLDHFKSVNDTHGHPVGDTVLETIGRVIRSHLRDADIAGRVGGEEFGVILPETDAEGARELADRLRAGIAEEPHRSEKGVFTITASLGVAAFEPPVPDADTLFKQADDALYRAKAAGRNRVSR